MGHLYLGAASWSNDDWVGLIYPPGTPPGQYIAEYAKHFPTVEIDATFYRTPSERMVLGWRERTPEHFVFAAKVPQVITHEKRLVDCAAELEEFVSVMGLLGKKLGPLVFQFPYFNKEAFPTKEAFLERLAAFLEKLPPGYRYAVEIRNRYWASQPFLDLLRQHGVAYVAIDQAWMPPITQLAAKFDLMTADFSYVRWLGDRQAIEEITTTWDRLVIDRTEQMRAWVEPIRRFLEQGDVYGYFNNHYAGYAPGSIRLFQKMLDEARGL